jgi:diguanylate cyclase (GGDEF)-like protein
MSRSATHHRRRARQSDSIGRRAAVLRRVLIPASAASAQLGRRESSLLACGFVVLLLSLAVTAGNALFGIGGRAATDPIRNWLSCVVYVLVAAVVAFRAVRGSTKRRAWAVFALGLAAYGAGNILWSFWLGNLSNPPVPSVSDGLWLSLYPLSYAGIVGIARAHGDRKTPAGVWLDGIIAGAGLAALGATLVFRPILASASGNTAAVATELAYPIADLLLAALVVGVLALRGWRIDRMWGLLGAGFLLLAVADCLFAVQVADGSTNTNPVTNLLYISAIALLGVAAWQPDSQARPRIAGRSVLLVPAGFTLVALGILFYDHVHRLDPLAFGLAALTLVAAVVRMALAFHDLRGLADARAAATTDELTGLGNRRLFIARVHSAIATAEPRGKSVSVLLLDIDNFKQLNDTLGHSAGDELLRRIGPRLMATLRDGDTVARLGGDEFAILLDGEPTEKEAARIAAKLLRALREPFEVHGLALRITASVGIATYPADAGDTEELMKRADVAMYEAKASRNGFEFYSADHDTNSQPRLLIAGKLASALEGDGIAVHFQPKVEAESSRITGVEALVRLRLPDGHMVAPLDFLAAAAHAGLSRQLTRRVLAIALDQLEIWRDAGHDIDLAVNTTLDDLLDTNFPTEVADELARRGLAPEVLILEVTETAVLSDPKRVGTVLMQLAELGVGLSLDDFGTGYSSLAHLKSFPVREVKIDRSFVAQMCTEPTDAAIVSAMIGLAASLGISVVAEGVEDVATREVLAKLGCELIQGYLVGRPVPACELEEQLRLPAHASSG